MMSNTNIRSAFVSTNSITQGEQVANVWKPLYDRFKAHIDFAYRTFIWNSEANIKAHVHCVIIGFSVSLNDQKKALYDNEGKYTVDNINPYLVSGNTIFIESRSRAICNVPEICKGFQATDNGLLLLDQQSRDEVLKKEPHIEKWIRKYSMGVEFINNIPRYCFWLKDISPSEMRSSPEIFRRVSECKKYRENAPKSGDAYKLKDTPHLFRPCKLFKDGTYIAIPLVSSSQRRYMPMAFVEDGMIPGNNLFCVFDASMFHFGVLTSNVHMSWIRAVGGYLKSDWRYSKDIVYNNFPWPTPTDELQWYRKVEQLIPKLS